MTNDPARLDGKLAIITGGGSGIGEATAHVFAHAGATVVVAGRRLAPLQKVAKDIGGHAIACDVSDAEDVRALFTQAKDITGRVDVLLNNAGGPGPIAPAPVRSSTCRRSWVSKAIPCDQPMWRPNSPSSGSQKPWPANWGLMGCASTR